MSEQMNQHLLKLINGLIHEDTQVHHNRVDLTVNRIFELIGGGALDFGGSEFESAESELIEPVKKNPDDDYGWWDLESGSYLITYNEQLVPGEETLLLSPLPRLIQAGASHDTQVISGDVEEFSTILNVGDAGCHLKENCRVTATHLLQN